MRFKGNFGELTLVINGDTATGNYQAGGELSGKWTGTAFSGTWRNKGLEGLVEFTINDGSLHGTWKKGLEPGPMKGKWWGEQVTNDGEETVSASEAPTQENEELTYHPVFPEVLYTSENIIACALASLIRHFIAADRRIEDGERAWMHEAMRHYEALSIPVGDVWDHVDDIMVIAELTRTHGKILEDSTNLLNAVLDDEEKNYLIKVLANIVAQDDKVTYEEFVGLSYTVEQFYPGAMVSLIENFRKNGISVDMG